MQCNRIPQDGEVKCSEMGCSGMGYRRRDQQGEMRWDRGSGMG